MSSGGADQQKSEAQHSGLPTSLPPRPPPSSVRHPSFREAHVQSNATYNNNQGNASVQRPSTGFGGFVPRKLGARPAANWQNASVSGPATNQTYPQQPAFQNAYPQQNSQWNQAGGQQYQGQQPPGYDMEMEAQIAQWQSAYSQPDPNAPRRPDGGPVPNTGGQQDSGVAKLIRTADGQGSTVVRTGGGQTWQDRSLLEWDPAHFRLFVGNLAGEVTDDALYKAFGKYRSIQKARVVRDKKSNKSKGYGFVSFSNGDDFFQAAREMQGKYIGSHPILLKKSTTEIRPVSESDRRKKKKGALNKQSSGGVQKKDAPKTRNGLKILG